MGSRRCLSIPPCLATVLLLAGGRSLYFAADEEVGMDRRYLLRRDVAKEAQSCLAKIG